MHDDDGEDGGFLEEIRGNDGAVSAMVGAFEGFGCIVLGPAAARPGPGRASQRCPRRPHASSYRHPGVQGGASISDAGG